MMNKKRLMAILAAGVLTATSFNPAMIKAESVSAEEAGMAVPADAAGMSVPADAAGAAVSADEAGAAVSADEAGAVVAGDGSETAVFSEDGTPVKKTVKAADINMKVQDSYDFPFLGLKAVLPEELKKQILDAQTLVVVEDLYRPYRPKRRTRATIAKEKGLELLADIILLQMTDKPVEEEAKAYISEEKGVKNVTEALNGAKDIIAERISDEADYRIYIRNLTTKNGSISSTAKNADLFSYFH